VVSGTDIRSADPVDKSIQTSQSYFYLNRGKREKKFAPALRRAIARTALIPSNLALLGGVARLLELISRGSLRASINGQHF